MIKNLWQYRMWYFPHLLKSSQIKFCLQCITIKNLFNCFTGISIKKSFIVRKIKWGLNQYLCKASWFCFGLSDVMQDTFCIYHSFFQSSKECYQSEQIPLYSKWNRNSQTNQACKKQIKIYILNKLFENSKSQVLKYENKIWVFPKMYLIDLILK